MFGVNKVFRANKGFPLLYRPGGSRPYRQYLPYRVFPEGNDRFPGKGKVIGVFPAQKPPFAVLLNGVSRRDKAEGRQGWRLE
jgi:hypothetical protein